MDDDEFHHAFLVSIGLVSILFTIQQIDLTVLEPVSCMELLVGWDNSYCIWENL